MARVVTFDNKSYLVTSSLEHELRYGSLVSTGCYVAVVLPLQNYQEGQIFASPTILRRPGDPFKDPDSAEEFGAGTLYKDIQGIGVDQIESLAACVAGQDPAHDWVEALRLAEKVGVDESKKKSLSEAIVAKAHEMRAQQLQNNQGHTR